MGPALGAARGPPSRRPLRARRVDARARPGPLPDRALVRSGDRLRRQRTVACARDAVRRRRQRPAAAPAGREPGLARDRGRRRRHGVPPAARGSLRRPHAPARDGSSPTQATAGARIAIRGSVSDDSGRAALTVELLDGSRLVGRVHQALGPVARLGPALARFATRAADAGRLAACAVAVDAASNRSPRACAAVTLRAPAPPRPVYRRRRRRRRAAATPRTRRSASRRRRRTSTAPTCPTPTSSSARPTRTTSTARATGTAARARSPMTRRRGGCQLRSRPHSRTVPSSQVS